MLYLNSTESTVAVLTPSSAVVNTEWKTKGNKAVSDGNQRLKWCQLKKHQL